MGPRRQSLGLACTPHMMATVITLGLALSAPAQAELAVTLVWSPTATVAPAQLVVTASVSGDDPVLEYAWQGLDGWPPCVGPRCDVALALASCRRVGLQVTGLSGALVSTEAQVCADDDLGPAPQAHMELQMLTGGLRIRRGSTPGGAEIVSSRLFVDELEVHEPFVVLEPDEGCHAVDLLVVDALGRTGQDRRQACFSEAAPQVRMGARPTAVTQDELHSLCAELRHPLGLPMTQVRGPMLSQDGCAPPQAPPNVLRRPLLRVQDERGVETAASLWVVRAPQSGPPTLPWLSPSMAAWPLGRAVQVQVVGGQAPFTVQAEVTMRGLRWPVPAEATEEPGRWILDMPDPGLLDGDFVLTATVHDARQLGTHLSAPALPASGNLDGGVEMDGGSPGPNQALSASCTNISPQGALHVLWLLLFLGARSRRRS